GSPLLTQLHVAGVNKLTTVASTVLTGAREGDVPLATSLIEEEADGGIGVDCNASMRLAAARKGLHSFCFFHEDWLGRGCVSPSPSVSAIGMLAKERGDLLAVARALLGKELGTSHRPGRILDLSRALYPADGVPEELTNAMRWYRGEDDYETASWLLGRWQGADLAHRVLASREAAERLRPWGSGLQEELSEELQGWIQSSGDWSEIAVQSAYRKQAEIALTLYEVFEAYDAVVTPLYPGMTFVDEEDVFYRLALAPSLARQPIYTMPVENGMQLQFIFPNLNSVAIP
ncbi:MAG: hypothetical protein ACQKBW_10615, partial [Puniceicoccales bacterium]